MSPAVGACLFFFFSGPIVWSVGVFALSRFPALLGARQVGECFCFGWFRAVCWFGRRGCVGFVWGVSLDGHFGFVSGPLRALRTFIIVYYFGRDQGRRFFVVLPFFLGLFCSVSLLGPAF